MKYAYQVMIIGGISLAGELLNYLLPLPVPASVYGMLLLLICLCTKVIKLDQIQETADFMLVAMPLVFVGPVRSVPLLYREPSESPVYIHRLTVWTSVCDSHCDCQDRVRLQQ